MRLSLDFDGVLANTMLSWCERYNELYGKSIGLSDIKDWKFYEGFGLPMDKAFEIFDYCWENWINLLPLEQNQDVKTEEMFKFAEVDVVTSVPAKHEESVYKWLKHHGIKYNSLYHSDKKYELDYPVYVDDSPANFEKIVERKKQCILYDQQWNRKVDAPLRVNDLSEAIEKLRLLNEKP